MVCLFSAPPTSLVFSSPSFPLGICWSGIRGQPNLSSPSLCTSASLLPRPICSHFSLQKLCLPGSPSSGFVPVSPSKPQPTYFLSHQPCGRGLIPQTLLAFTWYPQEEALGACSLMTCIIMPKQTPGFIVCQQFIPYILHGCIVPPCPYTQQVVCFPCCIFSVPGSLHEHAPLSCAVLSSHWLVFLSPCSSTAQTSSSRYYSSQ